MHKTLLTLAAAAGLAVAATAPGTAATHPLATDPVGDAGLGFARVDTVIIGAPNNPGIDIVWADINADATTLAVSFGIDDLAGSTTVTGYDDYSAVLQIGGTEIDLEARRNPQTGDQAATAVYRNESNPVGIFVSGVGAAFSVASGTVVITVPLADLNALAASLGDPPVGVGSVVDHAPFWTSSRQSPSGPAHAHDDVNPIMGYELGT